MKRLFAITLGLIVAMGLAFGGSKGFRLYNLKREIKKRRTPGTLQYEKPIIVVIPSYNNEKYCEHNLRSVFDQKYSNFRVIYIDDASKDGTPAKVQAFFKTARKDIPATLIHNETNRGALANLYNAIHSCPDDAIIVTVDGDDYLAHEYVLDKLNRIYSNDTIWMTYGNFLNYPTYTQTPVTCKQIPYSVILNNSFRKAEWVSSHLRTFYAGLFKKIKLQDFLLEGRFLPMGWDLAFMLPMLEMSGKRAHFVKDVLYLYNRENPINDHKVNLKLQSACNHFVRDLRPYTPITTLEIPQQKQAADCIVFSYDRPMQLYALLESLEQKAKGLEKTHVIYRASSQEFDDAYQKVFTRFSFATPLKEDNNFRELFFQAFSSPSPYLIMAVDDIVVTDTIDLTSAIASLKATHAYGFYFSHGKNLRTCYMQNREQPLPTHVSLNNNTYAWQFDRGEADWNYPNTVDMALYKKSDIENDLRKISFHNPPTLESNWAHKSKRKKVGLFSETSKSVNLPLNLVSPSTNRHSATYTPGELLSLFNQGLKIDIAPLDHLAPPSRHMDYKPTLVKR